MMATICGIIVLSILGILLLAFSFMGIMASSDAQLSARKNSIFVLKLNGMVEERSEDEDPFSVLLSQTDMEVMGLDDILSAIKKARDEENIKGIYIEGGATVFDSPATAQQIRNALYGNIIYDALDMQDYISFFNTTDPAVIKAVEVLK